MVSNKLTVLAASAALFESALGFNAHRHLHNDKRAIDKRAMETDWVTEWVTVWVTPGEGDAIPASCTGAVTDVAAASSHAAATTQAAAESAAESVKYKAPASSKASSTTTSTTIVVVPTTAAAVTTAEAVNNGEDYQQPQTTLTTAVKSEAAVSKVVVQSSAAESEAAVPTTTEQAVVEAVTSSAVKVATSKAAATTTTAAAKSESTGSSSSYSGSTGISSKRGVAYNDGELASTFSSSCKSCGWGYNWGATRDGLDESVTFIPTLWSPDHSTGWEDNANSAISSGSKVLFSFNEPDMPNQATMEPAVAAAAHVKYMNPFKGKALIAAPSVSNSGTEGQGLSYLAQWIEACEALDEQCHYDFCNIHWYSAAQYSDTLFTQIESAKKVCGGKPIWLTEFAPTDTDETTINSFMEEVIPKLEAIDYLEGYSYFMVKTGLLMTDSSSLSTYGQTYASASA
ncbi:glycosyl hydrolase catalytic core-domain-containing protein [Thelonectria olida]|uniref:Glycosyl hydrolase catalytic core-domain-containing protein n=1 Tax=Thelonectria olida TaxID=1576542 RepID=A0A9P9AW81_9HYPO|nr:glycosyl hydrolase catalytic core-domain-containing protein [Thelonectria olida]